MSPHELTASQAAEVVSVLTSRGALAAGRAEVTAALLANPSVVVVPDPKARVLTPSPLLYQTLWSVTFTHEGIETKCRPGAEISRYAFDLVDLARDYGCRAEGKHNDRTLWANPDETAASVLARLDRS